VQVRLIASSQVSPLGALVAQVASERGQVVLQLAPNESVVQGAFALDTFVVQVAEQV